jgi:hypothetical protein
MTSGREHDASLHAVGAAVQYFVVIRWNVLDMRACGVAVGTATS